MVDDAERLVSFVPERYLHEGSNDILLTGRRRIVTELSGNPSIKDILDDLQGNADERANNAGAAAWLWDYVRNVQPILKRADDSQGASSNNKIVVNFAAAISRNLSAYTFPKGINYLSKSNNETWREFINDFNKMMSMKSGNVAVQEMKWYQSVCGHAFLYVNYDREDKDIPFFVQNVQPWKAFVVYSARNVYKPVYAGIIYKDETVIFTNKNWYRVDNKNNVVESEYHGLGEVPVIEVPNNTMRMGDFECAITLLDGINTVASDSVNNVQDVVKSYLVLLGVEPNEAEKLDFTQGSVIALSCPPGTNQSANFIHPSLDGTTVQNLRSYLDSALKFVTGIPDRDTENFASSTGISEDIRTGQADKDAVANEKTIFVEESQRRVLSIIFRILADSKQGYIPEGMTAADIDVDITRANRDNILTKSQAMCNFKTLGMANEDILYFGNITNDVNGVAARMGETEPSSELVTEDLLNENA